MGGLLRLWRWLIWWLFGANEATRLNLRLWVGPATLPGASTRFYYFIIPGAIRMAKIGDTFTARIAPTNAAGQPAPVSDVSFVEVGDGYTITLLPDGVSAILVADFASTGNSVEVTAFTASGKAITESVALPDVEANVDNEAVALNLTVA
jgi:hypothetical protein